MAWWKDRSAGAGKKRGLVTTLGESPDRGSGWSVSGPHEWPPPEEGVLCDKRELRRAGTQASYDEKKRKKSRTRFIDFFRRVLPAVVALRTSSRKLAAKVAVMRARVPPSITARRQPDFRSPPGACKSKAACQHSWPPCT
jgi:hypothetical protein